MTSAGPTPLRRAEPLAGRGAVAVVPLPFSTRLSFRGGAAALDALSPAFGHRPSETACRATAAGSRAALWLGPDEWMLLAPADDAASLTGVLEQALAGVPHSLVDVSHRNSGFEIRGEAAAQVLNEGCPLDLALSSFPVGMCTRTVLAKAEVGLWRQNEDDFRLECWRSFAPYVRAFLAQAVANQG